MFRKSILAIAASLMTLSVFSGTVSIMAGEGGRAVQLA